MAAGKPGTTSALDSVRHLIAVADCDTVYRDLYLGRAEALLGSALTRQQFREARNTEQAIAAALGESRAATVRSDWARVEEHAERAEQLRRALAERAPVVALGAEVYEATPTALDPFSPGLGQLAASDPFELRAAAVSALAALERADAEPRQLYGERRAYLEQLAVTARVADSPKVAADTMATADVAQRALDAAERGDAAALARYAKEMRTRAAQAPASKKEETSAPTTAVLSAAALQCPVDLAAPLPAGTADRAAKLGLAALSAAPLEMSQPLFDFIAAHIQQARPADHAAQREGASRVEAVSSAAGWPSDVSKAVRDLLDQFLRQVFVNSGGARYLPPFTTESILVEDFPEEGEAPATGPLLGALGLPRRRGLSRLAIDRALLEHGPGIVRDQLGLPPNEFRLVCVPPDIYTRVGRDKGWGKQSHWTHFDGYQVLSNGSLRALVGGDARYGGLNDLVSIAVDDERDGVIARFAVIRRARQVMRWR